jgi:hypothetical protein
VTHSPKVKLVRGRKGRKWKDKEDNRGFLKGFFLTFKILLVGRDGAQR